MLRILPLPYSSGDANDRTDIMVNGQSVSVTMKLENAWRRTKNVGEDKLAWADAICINQQDAAEKSVQVSMMWSIYSKDVLTFMKGLILANASLATDVWIWLGKAQDNSDAAMNSIRTVRTVNFDDPKYVPPKDEWKAIKNLWNRLWVGRLWVVQQGLLARKACVGRFCNLSFNEVVPGN